MTIMTANDPVHRPAHYIGDGLEVIDIIEDWGLGFHLGNALKYILRGPKKGNHRQDLEKAAWYVERARSLSAGDGVAFSNAPHLISARDVMVSFNVPHGFLRDAIDSIQRAALTERYTRRDGELTMALTALRTAFGVMPL